MKCAMTLEEAVKIWTIYPVNKRGKDSASVFKTTLRRCSVCCAVSVSRVCVDDGIEFFGGNDIAKEDAKLFSVIRNAIGEFDLKIGNVVEINNTLGCWLSLKILEIKSDDYIKGVVHSDRISSTCYHTCNICHKYSDQESNPGDFLYCCNGDLDNSCDFHVHKKCFKNINKNNKPCNCKLEYCPFQNGTIVYFKKSEVRYLY